MDDKPINQTPAWNDAPQPVDPLEPIVPQVVEDTAREAASDVVDDMNATVEDTSQALHDAVRKTEHALDTDPLHWEPIAPASASAPRLPAPDLAASAPMFAPKTNTMAVISLISGLVSWVLLPVVGGIVGLITGIMARNEIKKSGGAETGDGLAVAGIVISALNILAAVLCVCGFLAVIMLGIATSN